jgi:AraC family transcriptional regulator of adaptative response/methylated-DNA-[protein]-cysteine methyltransferase
MNLDANQCWDIMQRRDSNFDGVFFVGVRTTGIYCRPSCSARPLRKNIDFFQDSATARASGLRPCLRCHPDDILPETALVHAVCAFIDSQQQPPTLAAIAEAVTYSSFYVNRIFKKQTGITPRQYAAARQQERLSGLLRSDSSSITTAILDAGYASVGNAYYAQPFGMSLRDVRRGGAGLHIDYAVIETTYGLLCVAQTTRGICKVFFVSKLSDATTQLDAAFPKATCEHRPEALTDVLQAVQSLTNDHVAHTEIRLDIRVTAFQMRVYEALRRIPIGSTRTYQNVADEIGQPRATRAVAQACAQNPLAVIIPCHRVVHRDATRDGYRWGVARKQALLAAERIHMQEATE